MKMRNSVRKYAVHHKNKIEKIYCTINRVRYYIEKPFCHRTVKITREHAQALLQKFYPDPARKLAKAESSYMARENNRTEYDLQIIVPAYNVEQYLEACMESILSQETSYAFQVILVEDGATDCTREIAKRYTMNEHVRVVFQENQGVAAARNRGLALLTAPYVMFVDSDDMLAPGAIEACMQVAYKENADIVEGTIQRKIDCSLSMYRRVDAYRMANAAEELIGQPWGKVIRSSLFEEIRFPEGYWFEDTIGRFLVYELAKKTILIPEVVYVYRLELSSISQSSKMSRKCIDTYWVTARLLRKRKEMGMAFDACFYQRVMEQILLNAKRVKDMPREVREAIFVLTGALVETYFAPEIRMESSIWKLFESGDYGEYALYCKTHSEGAVVQRK
ncbi:MAG: glycosyltransferase [Lachnospiraceae bacterium]|nr:glycosyltransferase [Lachnospiraceae bacterium]